MRKFFEFSDYVSIGTGMALACSSFMVIGGVLEFVSGPWLLLAIASGGLLTFLIALSVAEWASLLPGGLGISAYLKSAFGERTSLFFMFLYLSLVGCLAGVESYVFTQLLEQLFPGNFPALPSALAILGVILALNLAGLEFSRGFQMFTTVMLSVGVLALAGLAFQIIVATPEISAVSTLNFSSGFPGGFFSAMGASIFLFVGFEWVAPMGRSPQAYRRLIPFSMMASVIFLALLYGVFALALIAGPGSEAARGSAVPQFVLSAWALGGPARYVAAGLSLLAIATSFNAGLLGAGRMIYALARQKRIPALFAQLSERNGHPRNAVLLAGTIAVVSATIIIEFELPLVASALSACIVCFIYGALLFGLLKFRRTHPVNRGGFHSPVPAWLQAVLAIGMPTLGIAALFVDAAYGPGAVGVLAVLCLAAWIFSSRALKSTRLVAATVIPNSVSSASHNSHTSASSSAPIHAASSTPIETLT
jgi:amino acid transporter